MTNKTFKEEVLLEVLPKNKNNVPKCEYQVLGYCTCGRNKAARPVNVSNKLNK